MHLKTDAIYAVFTIGVVGAAYYIWQLKQAKDAAAAGLATGNGAYTSQVMQDAAGENIAVDMGSGGLLDVPATSIEYDAYTGTLSTGIDPTTGEVAIGNTEDITEQQLGLYSPQIELQPALSQAQIDALNGD
jgi:hypothetical protein